MNFKEHSWETPKVGRLAVHSAVFPKDQGRRVIVKKVRQDQGTGILVISDLTSVQN